MPRLLCQLLVGKSCHRRSLSAALLAAYIVTAAGVPLPSGGATAQRRRICILVRIAIAAAHRPSSVGGRAVATHWPSGLPGRGNTTFGRPSMRSLQAQLAGMDLAWLGMWNSRIAFRLDDSSVLRPCRERLASNMLPETGGCHLLCASPRPTWKRKCGAITSLPGELSLATANR